MGNTAASLKKLPLSQLRNHQTDTPGSQFTPHLLTPTNVPPTQILDFSLLSHSLLTDLARLSLPNKLHHRPLHLPPPHVRRLWQHILLPPHLHLPDPDILLPVGNLQPQRRRLERPVLPAIHPRERELPIRIHDHHCQLQGMDLV